MKRESANFQKGIILRVLPLLVGVLLVVGTWLFLLPKIKEIRDTRDTIKKETQRLERLSNKLSDLEGLNEFELSQRTQAALQAIAAEKNFSEVLSSIERVAMDTGLILDDFRITVGELAPDQKGKTGFKIKVTGDVEKIGSFIKKMEESLPLVTPTGRIQLQFEGESTTELTLESYFIPFPKTLGLLDSPVPKLTAEEEEALKSLANFTYTPANQATPSAGRPNPFAF